MSSLAGGVPHTVEYRLLGSFEVIVDGAPTHCGGVKQRSVLAMLLLDVNRLVTIGRLTDGLWADDPPARSLATVQVYVSGLRKLLAADGESPITTRTNGYILQASPEAIDVERFTSSVAAAVEAGRWQDDRLTLSHLETALGLWRGDPLGDFIDQPFAAGPASALQQQYEGVVEQRFEVLLRLGEHRAALPALEEALAVTPLRESLWRLLIVALYRSGRQADALAAFARCRDLLVDQLGVDPSPETQALEMAVLQHDPELAAVPNARRPPTGEPTIPAGYTGRLVLRIGDRRHEVTGTTLIGRSDDCDIVIAELQVSRHHAEIRRTPSGWLLTDLSLNGTMVAGERRSQRSLNDGDDIVVGSQVITVERPA